MYVIKIVILGIAIVCVVVILIAKAIHTAAMFMDDSFRWGNRNGKIKEE